MAKSQRTAHKEEAEMDKWLLRQIMRLITVKKLVPFLSLEPQKGIKMRLPVSGLLRSLLLQVSHVEKFSPSLILLLASSGREDLIPLYSPTKKSVCATSCPGREVSVNGNATERWCLLGETNEAQGLSSGPGWRHQTPPPQSRTILNKDKHGANASKWVWIKETKYVTWRTSEPEAWMCLRALLLRNFFNFLFSNPNHSNRLQQPSFRLGTSSGTHSKSSN